MLLPPIVTLTTDFGLRDPFVGIMKGVILGICPGAQLVDLTHEVPPQDVLQGCLALESAWRYFPAGSVHLAVVDPGVGSARRALAVRAAGHCFVAPDNGLLSFALDAGGEAVSVEAAAYRLPEISRTFHGRDVFAPAAAHLAAGVPLERLGPAVTDPVRIALPRARRLGAVIAGEVIGADGFGNLLTSVRAEDVTGLPGCGELAVELDGRPLGAPVACYADGDDGAPRAIWGSSGRLEIFVRNADARRLLGGGVGTPVSVERGSSAG
jgi:S-adenosylmethionine hydrolase